MLLDADLGTQNLCNDQAINPAHRAQIVPIAFDCADLVNKFEKRFATADNHSVILDRPHDHYYWRRVGAS